MPEVEFAMQLTHTHIESVTKHEFDTQPCEGKGFTADAFGSSFDRFQFSADAVAIVGGILSAHLLQSVLTPAWRPEPARSGALGFLILVTILALFAARRAYSNGATSPRGVPAVQMFGTCSSTVLALALIVRMLTDASAFPGMLYLLMAIAIPMALLSARLAAPHLHRFTRRWGRSPDRRILIVTDRACREIAESVHRAAALDQIVSIRELPGDRASRTAFLQQLSREADPADQDEIWLAVSWTNWPDIAAAMAHVATFPLPVRLLPDPAALRILAHRRGEHAGVPTFELRPPSMPAFGSMAKRALDIVGALAGLLLFAPLFLAVGLAIRFDTPGTILFRQMRGGRYGRPFRIWKFRTMSVVENDDDIAQAKRGDTRVTAIGRWLRSTSIDELPQFLNVLHGEMSLIGPRPHALAHDAQYGGLIEEYACRYHVKPGLTGWAQINGSRGETAQVSDMIRRVSLDVWYARHWSFALDVKILFQTLLSSRAHRAAY